MCCKKLSSIVIIMESPYLGTFLKLSGGYIPLWYKIVLMLKLKNSVTISVDPRKEMEVACAIFDIYRNILGDSLRIMLCVKYDGAKNFTR